MKKSALVNLTLIIFIIFFIFLRFTSNDWDQGTFLHPDERMSIMVTMRLNFFNKLNPDFFNYGSLPFYILQGSAQLLDAIIGIFQKNNNFFYFRSYDQLLFLGRIIASILDSLTLLTTYLISRLLFKDKKQALLAGFIYSISFFAIQNSNFYIVDNFINLFLSILFLLLLRLLKSPKKISKKQIILIAVTTAALLTSKITPIIYVPIIFLILLVKIYHQQFKVTVDKFKKVLNGKKILSRNLLNKVSLRKTLTLIKKGFIPLLLFISIAAAAFYFFMPYAVINHQQFITEISQQIKMNSDPYIFPYTLQYVDTPAYLYYVKNIFLWGFGPINSFLFIIGISFLLIKLFISKKAGQIQSRQKTIILTYLLLNFYYFAIIGRSAVKFMRYMLPIYPFMAIVASYGFLKFLTNIKNDLLRKGSASLIISLAVIWTLSFFRIYQQDHTRVKASSWIKNNIPPGKTLAVEHWDDRLPLSFARSYQFVDLPLYDHPDNNQKWNKINENLNKTDYIIIASNRLYLPLTKLADCNLYKRCYPKTNQYYQQLFAEELGFEKVAEFSNYPTIPLLKIKIKDDSADESFTVYDHPKVMIFKRK